MVAWNYEYKRTIQGQYNINNNNKIQKKPSGFTNIHTIIIASSQTKPPERGLYFFGTLLIIFSLSFLGPISFSRFSNLPLIVLLSNPI
jgi:hypothetical protein